MRLRPSLFLLSVATAAPILALSGVAAFHVFDAERTMVRSTATMRNRATLEAVDAELRGTVSVLRSLAVSPSIDRDDLQAFHREATAVLRTQATWQNVVLLTAEGRQLVNARLPYGTELPQRPIEPVSLRAAVSDGKPSIGNLSHAPLLNNEPGVAVRLPIERNGRVALVLTAVIAPSSFQHILEAQKLPQGWVSGLVGTDGRIIARVPPVPPGTSASPDYLAHAGAAAEGWYRGQTVEGHDTFTAFSRSALTGWTVGYAIPAPELIGGPLRAVALLLGGMALSLLFAVAVGAALIRRIATPIAQLSAAAPGLGGGQVPQLETSMIAEIRTLAAALGEAARTISDRNEAVRQQGAELVRQAEQLREVDEHRNRFLAQVSHELRTPLSTLNNALHLLKGSDDAQAQARARAILDRQVRLLKRLVDDMIDVGRVGRGELELRLTDVDVGELLADCIDASRLQVQAKRQSLDFQRLSPAAVRVRADRDRLSQVFTNLLSNATRYTPEGGRIEVTLRREEGQVLIEVADNGVGFQAADVSTLFDMYVRVRSAAPDAPGGLGIGLAVTRAIVEAHGGRVRAHSDGVGRGASFVVSLPVVDPVDDTAMHGSEARAETLEGRGQP